MATTTPLKLVFTQPAATSNTLVFGDTGDAPFVPAAVEVDVQVSLGGVTVAVECAYDNRVSRWLDARVTASHQVAQPIRLSTAGGWDLSQHERGGTAVPWGRALCKSAQPMLAMQPSLAVSTLREAKWQLAAHRERTLGALHSTALFLALAREASWQNSIGRQAVTNIHLQAGIPAEQAREGRWQVASAHAIVRGGLIGASLYLTGLQWFELPWQTGANPRPGLSVLPRPPTVDDPCYVPSTKLVFKPEESINTNLVFVCERHGPGPGPGASVVVPIKEVYLTINSALLVRVDNGRYIPATSMSMSLDVDSWTWSFSAAVAGSALADLQPNSNGDPTVVQATLNGVDYRFAVERVSRERTFNASQLRVSGRGLGAELDAPYSAQMSFGNTQVRTARQLIADILTINNVPIGWAVGNWGPTDWRVPAGVFSHQGTYISAMNAVVGAVGAYLQPHNTGREFDVLLRYPTPAWEWSSVTPDFELPAAVTTHEGFEWADKPAYNRVYVMGQEHGVQGRYTRRGTAGDMLAPPVVDPLITHADAARQRGRAIISDTGRIATVTLRLPVLAETGIVKPGKFVRYVEGANSHVGVVRGVSVAVNMPTIYQTLTVETHVEPV